MALVEPVFFDTTVLVGGYIDFGEASLPAQKLVDAVADGIIRDARTAWHCCLELYSVATRLPAGYRLAPSQICQLLKDIIEIFRVEQLPGDRRLSFLETTAGERVAGGRIYDAHIAEIARLAGAGVVVTDNRRHFTILMKQGVRILQPSELLSEL
jgi:predicted nucleic acid-binding protein